MASTPSPDATLRLVVSALLDAGIQYMVTGSFASSVHGEPRATQDLDLVIAPTPQSLNQLLNAFPEDRFYVSHEAARNALSNRGMFHIIEFETGWKIDLMIQKDRPFSREEFSRRRETQLFEQPLVLASAEDVILAKLEWSQSGGSARQLEDVAAIVRTQGQDLDRNYISKWAMQLGFAELWQSIDRRQSL